MNRIVAATLATALATAAITVAPIPAQAGGWGGGWGGSWGGGDGPYNGTHSMSPWQYPNCLFWNPRIRGWVWVCGSPYPKGIPHT